MRETAAFLMLPLSHEAPRLVRSQDAHGWDRSRPCLYICPHIGGFFAEYPAYVMPILLEHTERLPAERMDRAPNIVPH